jgi:hypothetical protein
MKEKERNPEEAWETGKLGASEEFAIVSSDEEEKAVDDALGLQLISIRFQKELISKLKEIALIEGIGYQPLMRQVMTRFAREYNSERKIPLKKAR